MTAPDSQYFVGWGTLALINANLAKINGDSALATGLLSLLLGPIVTFLLLLRSKPDAPKVAS